MHRPVTLQSTVSATSSTDRWRFLDMLRGFALLGILLVNVLDMTGAGAVARADAASDPLRDALFLTVQTRFVPIFVLLFGMSLWFVAAGARARSPRPWLVMLRRLVVLAGIGALLGLVYPGNVLLEYGIVGLLVLPIVLLAPPVLTLTLGVVGTLAAYGLAGGGLLATPGIMLLGAGAAACGLPRALELAGWKVAAVFAMAAALTVPALLWQSTTPGDPRFTTPGGIAGLVMAVLYVTALALLWRTPARSVLAAIFEPLGRMALSNYVGAACVVAIIGLLVDFTSMTSVLPAVLVAIGLIAAQSIASRLWLSAFIYGPIEWSWRTATWWRPARMLRTSRAPRAAAPSMERSDHHG